MDTQEHDHEREVWERFVHGRSANDRELLIEKYKPFANMMAAKLYANRQVDEIDFEEYRQYAYIGMLEAIDRYDPQKGASFKTYASHRIKGSILDGVEKHCEHQQQITARARLREERMENLLQEAGEVEQDAFMRLVDVAIGVAIGYMLEDSGMYQAGEGAYEHNVYQSHELSDLVRIMATLVATLPEQEQYVIRHHYYQHMRFDEIAQQLQLSKGRISQIHHRALRRLHEHYDQLKLLRTDY